MSALCPTAAACNWPSLRTGLQCALDRSLLTSVTTAFSAPVSPVTTSVVRDGLADGEPVGSADGLPVAASDGTTGAAAPGCAGVAVEVPPPAANSGDRSGAPSPNAASTDATLHQSPMG